MKILGWLSERWQAESVAYSYVQFEANHVDIGAQAPPISRIRAGEHYYRLWLAEMSLENDRKWFTEWQPAVYSVLRLRFGDRDEVISHVAGPSSLGQESFSGATRRVALNYALTSILPFNGGDLEIEAGLLAVPGKNDVKGFLKALGGFSDLLVVPELSTALNVTSALADGLGELVGATQARPELRLHQTFTGGLEAGANALRSGYFAALGVKEGAISASELWVKQGRLMRGTTFENAVPLAGVPYMLFRIEASVERDDWDSLTSIREPYEQALARLNEAAYATGEESRKSFLNEAERCFGSAKVAALRARELTRVVGRNQVIEAMKRGFGDAKAQLTLGAVSSGKKLTLRSAMERRITVDEARALGEAKEQNLLRPSRPRTGSSARPRGAPSLASDESLPEAKRESEASDTMIVRRTPHMEISKKLPLKPCDKISVRVYADLDAPRSGETSKEITAVVPLQAKTLDVDVWIAGTPHFTLGRVRNKLLRIPLDAPSNPVKDAITFDLTVARKLPADASEPRLWAYFTHNGRPCGQVSIGVAIHRANTRTLARARSGRRTTKVAPPAKVPATPASISVLAIEQAPAPDLTIEITDPQRNQRALQICLRSPHLSVALGPIAWHLPDETGALVTGFMKEFVKADAAPKQRLLSLRGAGYALWETVPGRIRDAIWKLIDEDKLQSILVVSEEPNVPWELMIPTRGREERLPLGVTYSVGRWIPNNHVGPPHRIKLGRSLVIAPDYPGPKPRPLQHARLEAQQVMQRFPGEVLKPVDFVSVDDALFVPGYDLVHWVCHGASGSSPGVQAIYLEDAELTSLQVSGMRGKNLGLKDGPFVFLNACEVGRLAPALAGIAGFAKSFIDLGACAVVAPLWSVEDDIANRVANEFYDQIDAKPGVPFGVALQSIRSKAYVKTGGPDTYAAYCFYGDPTATLER